MRAPSPAVGDTCDGAPIELIPAARAIAMVAARREKLVFFIFVSLVR
jgi:hypothetical protein